jgi:cobalt/nickel transport system permease protein
MHLPNHFLDATTAATTAVLAAAGLGIAFAHTRRHLPRRRVPLMGLTAAFLFAAQMINFPVGAGTSGHLVGGVLAAVLLGPAAAAIVITAVLIVQCLVFNDGGLLALGANIFNMAIVGAVGGWGIYYLVHRLMPTDRGRIAAAAFAAWCATVAAAAVCAGQMAFSGIIHWGVLPAMAGVHMVIGVGEATITAMVLVAISGTRPELLRPEAGAAAAAPLKPVLAFGLLISLGIGIFASPFASDRPDGLERVADEMAFAGGEPGPPVTALLPDYGTDRIPSQALANAVAGGIGTVIVFGLSMLLARLLVPARPPTAAPAGT